MSLDYGESTRVLPKRLDNSMRRYRGSEVRLSARTWYPYEKATTSHT